nr:hypothetical protein CFP56_63041 [Quercus suber]
MARLAKLSSAANAVFDTVELLESILLHLPMKDLLLSQRVSRAFRMTVLGSRVLQQALFFVPRMSGVYLEEIGIFTGKSWHMARITEQRYEEQSAGGPVYECAYYNPLLCFGQEHPSPIRTNRILDEVIDMDLRARPSAKHPVASWRRMLLTQPPTYLLFSHAVQPSTGNLQKYLTLLLWGPTMGTFMDELCDEEQRQSARVLFDTHGLSRCLETVRVCVSEVEVLALMDPARQFEETKQRRARIDAHFQVQGDELLRERNAWAAGWA